MANNKVVYDGATLIDLTSDTVSPETLLTGATAHDASGVQITGTASANANENTPTDINGILKGDGTKLKKAVPGTDYAIPPASATVLPASGTALTANTIYAVADAVGTYAFTPPATGWAHGKFTTGSSASVSFAGTFMGAAPTIEASKAYEFDVFDGVWAVQEVVSA